jgi:predicted HTH transcriptional regulator
MSEEFIRVLPILRQRGWITNEDIRNVLGVARNTASRRLREWTDIGWLQKRGSKKQTAYEPGANIMHHPPNASQQRDGGALEHEDGA